jgi:hypothetical protein
LTSSWDFPMLYALNAGIAPEETVDVAQRSISAVDTGARWKDKIGVTVRAFDDEYLGLHRLGGLRRQRLSRVDVSRIEQVEPISFNVEHG